VPCGAISDQNYSTRSSYRTALCQTQVAMKGYTREAVAPLEPSRIGSFEQYIFKSSARADSSATSLCKATDLAVSGQNSTASVFHAKLRPQQSPE